MLFYAENTAVVFFSIKARAVLYRKHCFSLYLKTCCFFLYENRFLNKKHITFGLGLELLKFGPGNRVLNEQHRRKNGEAIRKHEGKQRQTDKRIRGRDPDLLGTRDPGH